MATSEARDVELEDWAEPRATEEDVPTLHTDWLWALIAVVLLVALVAFAVDDHPLRAWLATP